MILETTNNKDFIITINNDDDKEILNVLKNKNITIIFKNDNSNIKLEAIIEENNNEFLIKTNYFNTSEPVIF